MAESPAREPTTRKTVVDPPPSSSSPLLPSFSPIPSQSSPSGTTIPDDVLLDKDPEIVLKSIEVGDEAERANGEEEATPESSSEKAAVDSAQTSTGIAPALAPAPSPAPSSTPSYNDPAYARHVAQNDPERPAMLAGDHLNTGQFSAGLSVDSDNDSAMGDIADALSTSSLRSSIYEYVEEHGRTFHKYKAGKYFMPNDRKEQDRLDLQHAVFMRVLKGKFGLAPVENPQQVLDIGTGTGIWAIEFANQHPSAHVTGTDLSPIQPDYVPTNCQFEVDDAEDEMIFGHPFDYIHLRLMFHAFKSHRSVMRSCYENLQPGGWMEWQDYYCHIQSVDGTIAGTALEKWTRMYVEGGQRLGRDMLAPRKYKQWMEEVGFVNVTERKLVIPGNPWPKGRDMKMLGVWQMTNFLEGLHAVSMTIFTRGLGMAPEEVEVFLVDVRKAIKDRGVHFYFLTYFVYGQKPPDPNASQDQGQDQPADE